VKRPRWRRPLLIAAAVVVLAGLAVGVRLWAGRSDPEALRLMARAATALQEVPVRGVVNSGVRTRGGWTETEAEVHRGEGRVHLKYLSGPRAGSEVFRQGPAVWAKGPQANVRHRGSVGRVPWQDDLIQRNYRVRIASKGELLGRPVTYVHGDGPAGRLRLAVDDATGFPLVMERDGTDGRALMTTTFARADFNVEPPPELEPPPEAARRGPQPARALSREQLQAQLGFPLLLPAYVPRGFELQGYYLRERGDRKMAEIRYADGLRVLLVMERKATERPREGARERGSRTHDRPGRGPMKSVRGVHGHQAVRRTVGETRAVVMGPLSEQELARIADSLRAVSGHSPAG
jgi:hypothetical protein